MKLNLNLKNPLVFFDLETTGVSVATDRIVELAFLKVMPNGDQTSFVKKINPQRPIPPETTKIHGIKDEDVIDSPTFKDVAKNLAKMLEGCDLAGFNIIKFDVPMLVEEFLRASVEFDIGTRKIIDVQRIFHMMEPRNLSAAYQFYCKQPLENAHTAEADNLATFEILNVQVEHYKDRPMVDKEGKTTYPIQNDMKILHELTTSNIVDFAGRMAFNDQSEVIFNFGKHKGKPVTKVLKEEPTYYDWMMKGDFPLNTKQKLTEIRLSMLQTKK